MIPNIHIDVDGILISYQIGAAAVLIFAILAELFLRRLEGKPSLPKDGKANFFLFLFGPVMEGVFANALLIAALMEVQKFTAWRIPVTGATLILYFIAGDFCFYWFHRLGHRIAILWADHSIHHSSTEFDLTVNLRHTPFSTFYRFIAWLPFVLVGFDPAILTIFAIMSPTFQIFCHTDRIGRMPAWFEWLFVTPGNHAVHHACNTEYLDKNYGGTTMLWDHLFGTYQALDPKIAIRYGITDPVDSNATTKILAHGFVKLWRKQAEEPRWIDKLRVLVGRPGSHPSEARQLRQTLSVS